MNRLVSKFLGLSVRNWQSYLQSCEETIASIAKAAAPVNDYESELSRLRAEFEAKPTPESCRLWVDVEGRRAAVFAVSQAVRDMLVEKRRALLGTGEAKGKMRDALAEIRSGLERRREQVVENDTARSLENGIPEISTATLTAIDRQVETVDDGLRWIEPDAPRAAGVLQTLIGS